MNWQDLRKVTPDTQKMLLLCVNNNFYFAKAFVLPKSGNLVFILSQTYKALTLDIKNELYPCYTLEQLQKRYTYWTTLTKPGEAK